MRYWPQLVHEFGLQQQKKKKKKKKNVEGTKKNGMIISYDYFINND
jgi:hypothetical protein